MVLWYVRWGCDPCSALLWQAGVSLCLGRDVGKGAGAGPNGEVRVVLLGYVFYIFECSVSVTAGMIVLCCSCCGLCLCICVYRPTGLQGWVCV